MKFIKSKLGFSILLLSTSCFATSKPALCPDVSALKAVGVQYAHTSLLGWQIISDKNHFGTKEEWVFGVILIGDKTQNEAEAIAKANAKISSLVLVSGPEKSNHSWECSYIMSNSDDPTIGIAATLPSKKHPQV